MHRHTVHLSGKVLLPRYSSNADFNNKKPIKVLLVEDRFRPFFGVFRKDLFQSLDFIRCRLDASGFPEDDGAPIVRAEGAGVFALLDGDEFVNLEADFRIVR
jgi:hypothetical protein